ncbi:MAG TPA: efflux transporter outer membrane subunit [Rhizomicrobium sp.]|jgi:NodT family efflux transporter outer membrane factor (OMF) lipoprotein
MKRLAAFLFSTALLSGCVSTPSTTPSEKELKSETLGLSATTAPAIADKWWTAFGDPQLDTLVDQALAGNPRLAGALARIREAQSELSATHALTYPQVTFDGNETRERFSKNYIIPPPYGGTTQWIGTVQANLSWSLDFFGKQQSQIDRAEATANAAALDAEAARLALAGSVTQAYISLSRAYALADVAGDAVKQRRGVLSLIGGRYKAGLDTDAARQQATALLATAEEDLTRANAVRDMAVHQIAALVGRGADAYAVTHPKLNDAALALPATLPADLLARRADIAASEARVEAAFAGREVARKAFYPDINLIGLAGWAAIGLGPMFSSSALQYGAGAAIHLPIFDAGKIRADYAGATAGLDEAVANYNAAVIGAVKDTADAMTELRATEDQAGAQKRALDAANASFSLAIQRYRSGLSPETNVFDAEDLLLQSRRQSAALAADTATARVTLLIAVGGGFDPKNIKTTIASQDSSHE